jgi:hypothetical protein
MSRTSHPSIDRTDFPRAVAGMAGGAAGDGRAPVLVHPAETVERPECDQQPAGDGAGDECETDAEQRPGDHVDHQADQCRALAAAVTGSGTTISHMAQTVGWATFAIEHMMFGLALGAALLVVTSRADRSSTTAAGSASRSGRRRRPGTSARSSSRRSLRSPPVCAATDHSP